MFWKFLAAFIAASALIYLGQLSVWVSVLGLGLKASLALFALAIVTLIVWHLYGARKIEGKGLIEDKS